VQERNDFSCGRRARFRTIRRLGPALALTALAVAAWPATAVPSPAPAAAVAAPGPALWVVQDADTTVYLFGTFHALDGRPGWFSRGIKAAFDASDELVLETLVPEDPAELHDILSRNSLAPKLGAPALSADKAPSFVASAGHAMSAGKTMGMSVDKGADAVLRRAAGDSGKPVAGLESFEYQLRMFASLPPPPANAGARKAAAQLPRLIGDMQAAWKRGDNASFAAILGTVESQSPVTYKKLFADRNANWAGWISDRMREPGTVFVAVGTGHLIGRDSVQQKLEARGIRAHRIS
jgi:uncharacterized protein